jgi:hypothetical protein
MEDRFCATKFLASVILVTLATACATPKAPDSTANLASTTMTTRGQMQGAAGEAARQPLRDIGLMKKKIPYALTRIADPYAEPSGPGCAWISYELTQLNAALGSEVAVMPSGDRSTTTTERGTRIARDMTSDMIRNASAALIPGRELIRRISGAASTDELYEAAKERGMVRRSYLKGLSDARSCA